MGNFLEGILGWLQGPGIRVGTGFCIGLGWITVVGMILSSLFLLFGIWKQKGNHSKDFDWAVPTSWSLVRWIFALGPWLGIGVFYGSQWKGEQLWFQNYATHDERLLGTGASYGSFWSNHEGSWMLWLGLVMVLLAYGSQKVEFWKESSFVEAGLFQKEKAWKDRVFWKHAWYYFQIPGLFWAYTLIVSSPFLRMSVVYDEPFDYANGLGLVPALQDTALACHPPLLFCGLAFCALIWFFGMILFSKETKEDPSYANHVFLWYEWAIGCTFGILTVGLAWGGFWAYSELGWGSYWFWDPVENAGLLPWLVVACLFHRQVQRKSNPTHSFPQTIQGKTESEILRNHGLWILGGMSLWPLSLFSTWGVRSGIFTSVHSFASDLSKTWALIGFVSFFVFLWCFYASLALLQKSNRRYPKGKFLQQGLWIGVFFVAWVAFGTYGPILWTVFGQDELHVGAAFFNPWVGAVGILLGWLLIQSSLASSKK